jgi:hypothetical protein
MSNEEKDFDDGALARAFDAYVRARGAPAAAAVLAQTIAGFVLVYVQEEGQKRVLDNIAHEAARIVTEFVTNGATKQ